MAQHQYLQGSPTCSCPDALQHAPCKECGGGRDAFQHEVSEPAPAQTVLAGDLGDGAEKH